MCHVTDAHRVVIAAEELQQFPKGWFVMKPFAIAVITIALLIPTFAAAQTPFKMVYRPELRGMVPVYDTTKLAPMELSRNEQIARHVAMAQALRGTARKGVYDPAIHCDRLIAKFRSAELTAR